MAAPAAPARAPLAETPGIGLDGGLVSRHLAWLSALAAGHTAARVRPMAD